MMVSPTTFILSLLLCTYAVNGEFITLFSREESSPNAGDIYGITSLKNSTLTYKICKKEEGIHGRKCKIFQENLNSENKQSKFCEITLNGEIDDENVEVVALGTDKAVVNWYDEAEETECFLRYTIVHFSDCKTAETNISFQKFEDRFLSQAYNLGIILPRDERTFDVLFDNSTVCGEKVCRLTLDDLGNQVSGPVAWFTALDDSFIYLNPNPINGAYLAAERVMFGVRTRISLLKSDGLKILKEFNHNNIDGATEYGLIRICHITNQSRSVACDLFDSAGKSNSSISIDLNYIIGDVDVINSPDGGFVLMITSKPSDSGFHFHVMNVDANGKQLGPVEIPNFECKAATDEKHSNLFQNKLGEYCASRVCYTGEKYNLLSKCFTIDDLVNK